MSEGLLVGLDQLNQIELLPDGLVKVGAGARLFELNAALDAAGRALPILGTVTAQTVAGAVSTGTHGSSLRHGNLASLVHGLKLVDHAGRLRELGQDDPDLPAARVGLGAFGVLTELTLKTVPAFRLQEVLLPLRWEEAIERLPSLVEDFEYVKLWWMPHTDEALVFHYTRTDAAPTVPALSRNVDEKLINGVVFTALLAVSRFLPAMAPLLNRLVQAVYFRPQSRVAPSFEALTAAMPPIHHEVEHSIPLVDTVPALRELRGMIEREGIRVNFPVEARFGPADDAWMSPSFGRASCHLGTYIGESPDYKRYFAGCTERLRALGGRPHWGKELHIDPDTVRRLYPRAAEFGDRVRTWDPTGRFSNPFLRRILGPP